MEGIITVVHKARTDLITFPILIEVTMGTRDMVFRTNLIKWEVKGTITNNTEVQTTIKTDMEIMVTVKICTISKIMEIKEGMESNIKTKGEVMVTRDTWMMELETNKGM